MWQLVQGNKVTKYKWNICRLTSASFFLVRTFSTSCRTFWASSTFPSAPSCSAFASSFPISSFNSWTFSACQPNTKNKWDTDHTSPPCPLDNLMTQILNTWHESHRVFCGTWRTQKIFFLILKNLRNRSKITKKINNKSTYMGYDEISRRVPPSFFYTLFCFL